MSPSEFPSGPRVRVELDGEVWDSFFDKGFFSAVSVKLGINKLSEAELTVFDEDYEFLDFYSRSDGVPVVEAYIWLGYGEDLGEPVFEGLLSGVGHDEEMNTTTIRFFDRGWKMNRDQKTETHKGSDILVMKKLVERGGLIFDGLGKEVKPLLLRAKKQEAQTDLEFFSQLADDAGLNRWVRGKTFYARRPARTSDPVVTFGRHDSVLLGGSSSDFRLPEGREGRPGNVEYRGRGRGGRRLSGKSDESKRGHKQIVINKSVKGLSKSEMERRAQAKKEMQREKPCSCRVRTLMLPGLRVDVQQTVEMEGRGELMSGLFLAGDISYSFAPGDLAVEYDIYKDFEESRY